MASGRETILSRFEAEGLLIDDHLEALLRIADRHVVWTGTSAELAADATVR
jgi:hypothetical protein